MSVPYKQIDQETILEKVKSLVLKALESFDARVFLFGSWARGEQRRTSDIDVAIEHKGNIDPGTIAGIREILEESDVPYFVDVVDLTKADPIIVKRIREEGMLWKDYEKD